MASNFLFVTLLAHFLQLVAAAPVDQVHVAKVDALQYGLGGGIIGFICLVFDVIAIVEVLQSTRPAVPKALWSLVIFFFPLVGVLIYFFFSDRKAHKKGYEVIP